MTRRIHGYHGSIAAITLFVSALLFAHGTAHATCLKKPMPVATLANVFTFMIAPQRALSDYLSLGFTPINCPADLTDVRAYVARLCSGAPDGPLPAIDPVLAIGLPRPRACADAQAGLAEAAG